MDVDDDDDDVAMWVCVRCAWQRVQLSQVSKASNEKIEHMIDVSSMPPPSSENQRMHGKRLQPLLSSSFLCYVFVCVCVSGDFVCARLLWRLTSKRNSFRWAASCRWASSNGRRLRHVPLCVCVYVWCFVWRRERFVHGRLFNVW